MISAKMLELYFGRFVSIRAVVIFVILLAMLIFSFCYAIHILIWLLWYPLQMKRWKAEYQNTSSEERKKFLLFVRRTMRLRALPVFLWWIK